MVAEDDGGGGGGGKMSKSEKDQVGRRGPSLYFLRGCLFLTLLHRRAQRKAVLLRATQLVARSAVFLWGPSESRKRGISAAAAVASLGFAADSRRRVDGRSPWHSGVTAEYMCGTDPRSTAQLNRRGLLVRLVTGQWWTGDRFHRLRY